MMHKEKVLFVCIHNSARSQMAEAWLNHLYGDRIMKSQMTDLIPSEARIRKEWLSVEARLFSGQRPDHHQRRVAFHQHAPHKK